MTHCPNCGTAWTEGADVCARCGFVRPPSFGSGGAWPPAPMGPGLPPPFPPPLPPAPRLVTGAAWGDVTLGIGLSLASDFLYCVGFIVMPILYFTLRAQYPFFARGIGYGFLAGAAVLLGAVAWCFYGISKG